jgi:hypothetical protein
MAEQSQGMFVEGESRRSRVEGLHALQHTGARRRGERHAEKRDGTHFSIFGLHSRGYVRRWLWWGGHLGIALALALDNFRHPCGKWQLRLKIAPLHPVNCLQEGRAEEIPSSCRQRPHHARARGA